MKLDEKGLKAAARALNWNFDDLDENERRECIDDARCHVAAYLAAAVPAVEVERLREALREIIERDARGMMRPGDEIIAIARAALDKENGE